MKLTKKIGQEVLKVYNTGWEAYMRGDLKTHGAFLSSKFKIIGTTEAEHFNSKKAWLAFCKKTIHQVVGVVQMRNRKIKLEAVGDAVLVVENSAIYVLIDGTWQFYSKLRITALMQKEKSGWKYVHQHGSLPDTRASENETIATEKIKKENQQLRDAVKRRTIELEEKNRELEIEAALEKVRAQALGMRTSEDLLHICRTLYKELGALGITSLRNAIIHVFHDEQECFTDYEYSDSTGGNITSIPYKGDVTVEKFIKRIRKSENAFVELKVEGKEFTNWKSFRKKTGQIKDNRLKHTMGIHYYIYSVGHASIGISAFDAIERDKKELLKRFRNVFDFAYRRYTDITLAQAQAREAQIEVAVERVRAQSMAMHHPDDLDLVNKELLNQLHQLQISGLTGVTFYLTNDNGWVNAWDFSSPGNIGAPNSYMLQFDFTKYEMLGEPFRVLLQSDQDYFIADYTLEKLKKAVCELEEINPVTASVFREALASGKLTHQWSACAKIANGILGVDLVNPPSGDTKSIVLKMAGAFNQAYTRFLDLQKAEAQAREAQIEAALEKVRGKAMAMHSSQDLADTIGVFYQELQNFSITPRRCGVGLLNKENREGEIFTWNTTEDGHSLELVGKVKMEGHRVLEQVYENWVAQSEFHPVLRGKEISEYYKVIRPQMPFPDYNKDDVQYGYFFFFPEGGVYAWTGKEMSEDELNIYRRFTSALSLTYKRYKDLKIAEAHAEKAELDLIKLKEEKKRTEDALTELQITQKQLIQAEKMASLGELTAGIAHEIQNPLNFVNNFSEVSNELIQEIQDIRRKTQGESLKSEEDELLKDIASNLEKILHHGKRADGIVKGMLQHSRSSSGVKEPTSINALADEYLRLAYHGLRAKDKSFNANMKTDFDESIGKINIVPQDIGRVILNLITNAFYAVNEKTKLQAAGYEPQVIVSTEKLDNKIEICVKDNGNGIPEQIKEKIFQPFFTTKPTGQGTGLGLSLSYDIVKAHGGNLYVETKESEGTIFTIGLPI